MCKFLSLVSNNGKVYFFNANLRKELKDSNYRFDSHASICKYYNLNEDKMNKWEVDIFPKIVLNLDMMNAKDDTRHVENYVKNNLIEDFGGLEELQLEAVMQNGYAIKCIENPSEAVQLTAVAQNRLAIRYIKNPSEAVKLTAIKGGVF